MLIRIKKVLAGVVTSCLRHGHEVEIQRTGHGGSFALHDLLHYSVETTLGFDEAFLGLMASGWSFSNFTRSDDPRYRPLPAQAHMAEHLVNVLSLHARNSAWDDDELLPLLTEEVNKDLAAAMGGCAIPAPKLTAADVAAVYQGSLRGSGVLKLITTPDSLFVLISTGQSKGVRGSLRGSGVLKLITTPDSLFVLFLDPGQPQGFPADDLKLLSGRDGYVVKSLLVDTDNIAAVAVKARFVRLRNGVLDERDSYQSDWIGLPSGIRQQELAGGPGEVVVGAYGQKGLNLDVLGLLVAPLPGPGPTSRPSTAQPVR